MNAYLFWAKDFSPFSNLKEKRIHEIREKLKTTRKYSSISFPAKYSRKAYRIAESIALQKQEEKSSSPEALEHSKKTNELYLKYCELTKATTMNQKQDEKNALLNEIYDRRDEYLKLFGIYDEEKRKALKDQEIKAKGKNLWKKFFSGGKPC